MRYLEKISGISENISRRFYVIFVARPIFTAFRCLFIRLSQHCEKSTSLLALWGCGIF